MAASRSPSWFTKVARAWDDRYLMKGSGAVKVTAFFGSKPGSTRWIAAKLRTMRPAPISSTSDSVTSLTTRAVRSLFPRAPPVSVPRSRSLSARLPRTARSAGASPNRSAATTVTTAANRNAPASSDTFSIRGRLAGPSALITRIPCQARRRPSTVPAAASTRLSVSIWATMRPRPLPIAARTAISRPRSEARTRSRLAMLAQAISSTKPTAPSSASSAGRSVLHHVALHAGHHDLELLGRVELVGLPEPRRHAVHLGLGLRPGRRRA